MFIGRVGGRCAAAIVLVAGAVEAARGETVEDLRRELEAMKETVRKLERRIEAFEGETPAAQSDAAALDRALAGAREEAAPEEGEPAAAPAALASRRVGGANVRLIDISLDAMVAAGTSTASADEIESLQGGAHDPRRRGFTLQQTELSLAGAVDPYFTSEVHVIATDEEIELEEAFATTQALPFGLQVEAGHFFTEFGRINPQHPHQWDWVDQPVVNTRLFGGEGLRNPGARVGWLLPVPWFAELHLGAQNATGDTAFSFIPEDEGDEGTAVGGRPVVDRSVHDLGDLLYLTRIVNGGSLTDTVSMQFGASALYGPNATGAHGRTYIYGGDLVVKWRPATNFRGRPSFVWQTEVMQRQFEADANAAAGLSRDTLYDGGLHTQALYGFRSGWAAGLRYEFATGSGASVGGRDADPLRADRHRLAPLVVWQPSEFSRLRLQYNWDDAGYLDDGQAHSVWLSLEVLYGAHPAHAY
jgi:hypothetical protein